ncbi:N-glycosylase/DNA lyase [Methanopyrus kandleri]
MTVPTFLRKVTLREIRVIEEYVDVQYRAIEALMDTLPSTDLIRLTVANALVSYQLSSSGEDWWREFSSYFRERRPRDIVGEYAQFLPRSRGNRRLIRQKLRRLHRAKAFLEELSWQDAKSYYRDMNRLRLDLARVLNADPESKTIVFAVKMFGYALRAITDKFRPYPFEIPIPVDARVERITRRITNDDPQLYWNSIARRTGIPPLHLDSILWVGTSRDPEVKRLLAKVLPKLMEELEVLGN